MYIEDFRRVKAQFCNNIAACYLRQDDCARADIYVNMALVLDPYYAFTYLRKCEVLESIGENYLCVQYAESALKRLFPVENCYQYRNCDSVKEALESYTKL